MSNPLSWTKIKEDNHAYPKAQLIYWSAGLFIVSMSPNGGEQSVATEVDGKTHGHFKDAYGPPEYYVGQPDSLVLTLFSS